MNFDNECRLNDIIIVTDKEFKLPTLPTKLAEFIENLRVQEKFKANSGEQTSFYFEDNNNLLQVLLIGLGDAKTYKEKDLIRLGGRIVSIMSAKKIKNANLMLNIDSKLDDLETYAQINFGFHLRNYDFNKYKSAEKLKDYFKPESLIIICKNIEQNESNYKQLVEKSKAIHFARNLISEPPNVLYPESFADHCLSLKSVGLEVEVLNIEDMKKLGMNALLGVGQGSSKESKLVIMKWNGGNKNDAPLAFIGKGVCFDTGGISLKPANGMEDMKYDMAGAAAVTGLMYSLAARRAKANIVGVIGLAENMPDGNAQRPSDVVRSMSGQTIEVLNTDAEGRLVLADALWYTQDRFKPKFMIDLATLTGAIVIALGNHHAGLFSNNDDLAARLTEAGEYTGERLWRLPLDIEHDKNIDSDIADVRNTSSGRGAGSTTAAQFLQRFTNNLPWAHLDIAGMAWNHKNNDFAPKGAAGFGIRLLDQFVKENYEN